MHIGHDGSKRCPCVFNSQTTDNVTLLSGDSNFVLCACEQTGGFCSHHAQSTRTRRYILLKGLSSSTTAVMSNTTSSANNSFDEHHFLPQLGFGSDVRFETIAGYHRYLFRVYTPKLLPAIQDESVFFVGSRFDYKFAPRTPIISEMYNSSCGPLAETGTYEDCIQHLNWETRSRSCFISTTFSFAWAIWDAVRRFETGVKHDVEIAVMDAAALSGKAVTTLQLLRKSPSSASK